MPRFGTRRHRFRGGFGFMSDLVPSDYTFDRIVTKLKDFESTSAKLRLINSHTPSPSHWARQQEKEHVQAGAAAVGEPPAAPEGTFAGARPALQSRLLVLDASFNPPTRAHAHMAKAAVHEVLEEQRAAVAEAERHAAAAASLAGVPAAPVVRPQTRLLLLLAVANADKAPQPAATEHRLAMIYAFARHLHDELRRRGDGVPVEMAVTSEPFFSGKARALRTASWYPSVRPYMTFTKCDQHGRKLPGKADLPPMEFIVGFDTLVRILNPKYYKADVAEEQEDQGAETSSTVVAAAAAAAATTTTTTKSSGNDVDGKGAAQRPSYKGKNKEQMTAEETEATQSPPDSLATLLDARSGPHRTPMMKALDPFFEHASLRVMLRPGEDHGEREAQRRYIAALAGVEGAAAAAAATGVRCLDQVGGDPAWMQKVRLLPDEDDDGTPTTTTTTTTMTMTVGVSSSLVRQRVHDYGPQGAEGFVYPLVLDWLKKHELYQRPRQPKGT
ncbi:hypothetical protein V2A60_002684 [Cordyceps javanica]|uniref:Cytidylyltransferase n=1 Tax=Cordyceps javanica TaxID=43265 RepID=A0A545VWP7_9HYPO|nr:cytidylyltransferase [Cordyceps javanica]TQW06148.1 cytidylyltransferase [Cordyceps javanica]